MQTLSHRPTARLGISLIEVLMSIGVLAIGLLGVAALIPVAGHQAQEGIRNDRLASVGKRAFRELQENGLLNPDRWVVSPWRTLTGLPAPPPFAFRSVAWNTPMKEEIQGKVQVLPGASPNVLTMPIAFCVDPLGFTLPRTPAMAGNLDIRDRSVVFDRWYLDAAAAPRIYRLSLDLEPALLRNPSVPALPVTPAQADEMFVIQDELDFEIPKKAQDGPIQKLLKDTASNLVKRSSAGNFSWMAMFVPVDRRPVPRECVIDNAYEVSVVVFENRTKYERPLPVRVEEIDGWGGGTARILTNGVTKDFRDRAKKGQWILLAGKTPAQDGTTVYGATDYQWYRIVAIDPGKAGYNWSMTLQGPDWKMAKLENSTLPDVWAIHMGNVVSVYTKTMYLERRPL